MDRGLTIIAPGTAVLRTVCANHGTARAFVIFGRVDG